MRTLVFNINIYTHLLYPTTNTNCFRMTKPVSLPSTDFLNKLRDLFVLHLWLEYILASAYSEAEALGNVNDTECITGSWPCAMWSWLSSVREARCLLLGAKTLRADSQEEKVEVTWDKQGYKVGAGIQGTGTQVRLLLPQAVTTTTPRWGSCRRRRTPRRVSHQNGSNYCHFWHPEESCCSNSYPHKCISYSRGEFAPAPLWGNI